MDLCELEVSLVYRENFMTARATHRKPCLKKNKQKNQMINIVGVYVGTETHLYTSILEFKLVKPL